MFPFSLFKRKQKLQHHTYATKPPVTRSISTGGAHTSSQPIVTHNHYYNDYSTQNTDNSLVDTLITMEVLDDITNRNNSSYDSTSYTTNNDSYYGGGDSGGAGWDSGSSSYDNSSSSDYSGGGGDFGGGGSSGDW